MVEFSKPSESLQTSITTLGSEAVNAAWRVATDESNHAGALADRKSINDVKEKNVPDPRSVSAARRFVNRVTQKPYAGPKDQRDIAEWLTRESIGDIGVYPIEWDKPEAFARWREHSVERRDQQLDGVRDRLRSYEPASQEAIDSVLSDEATKVPDMFASAKQAKETELGHDLSWVEWLTKEASNDMLVHVLEWNMFKVEQATSEPEFAEKVQRVKEGYERGLRRAFADGSLDDSGLRYALSTLEKTQVVAFGPLSEMNHSEDIGGMAHPKHHYVEIRTDAHDYYVYHELSHALFTSPGKLFNEATTEFVTEHIYTAATGESPPETDYSHYDNPAFADLMSILDMTPKDVLPMLMSSADRYDKFVAFRELTKEKTDYDFVLLFEKSFLDSVDRVRSEFGLVGAQAARRIIFQQIGWIREVFVRTAPDRRNPSGLCDTLSRLPADHRPAVQDMLVLLNIFMHGQFSK